MIAASLIVVGLRTDCGVFLLVFVFLLLAIKIRLVFARGNSGHFIFRQQSVAKLLVGDHVAMLLGNRYGI